MLTPSVLIRSFGDLLSPPRCAACSERAVRATQVFCPACAATVERCEGETSGIAFAYYGGALATAIRRFKYEDSPHLARPLGALVRQACRTAPFTAEVVVPVPLHPRRLVERGYNQSALLAHHVASELAVPLLTRALGRVIDTPPQAVLSGAARRLNMAAAFRVLRPHAIAGRTVALVDDVLTTGTTLAACRQALLAGGATSVTSVVVARTPASDLGILADGAADEAAKVQAFGPRASSGCAIAP